MTAITGGPIRIAFGADAWCRSESALGGGDLRALHPDGVAESSGHALERRLQDVVRVLAAAHPQVQRDRRRRDERAPELLGQLRVERRGAQRLRGGVDL